MRCKGNSTTCWEREDTQRLSEYVDSESVLTNHQVRTTWQIHIGHDCICNPRSFSLPKYITDSNFRDKLLKVLHCCTEKTGFIHFINSIGKILEHQFKQATESKKFKIFMKGIPYYYKTSLQLWDFYGVASQKYKQSQKKTHIKRKSTFGQYKETSSKEYLPNLNSQGMLVSD